LREIKTDTQAVWRERDQMLEGIRVMANDLVGIAKASVARVQPHEPGPPEDENPERGAGFHEAPTIVATGEPASAEPAGTQGSAGEPKRRG
jgi:hypothetical protein